MSIVPNLDEMTDEQKLAVLESVQKSIAESKEIQKRKIGENVELVVQALKKIESDIRDRFDGVGTAIEKRVASIKDGRDGADGKDGRDGKDGKSGRDGLKGDRGVDGQAGRDGVDGIDGVSVVNANIDFDGSLIISLSDGREINVGEVVSADVAEKIKVISTMSTNGAVAILDEGTSITSGVKKINFVGASVTATNSGDDVTVTVSGGGSGTVTSVAATAGTGISVSGSPITTSGTLTITNTAPDQTVALTQSGTTTITGTYPNFTISSADQFSGTVTSVAASVPAFLSVTGSPVTTTGTLAIGLSGTALPVLNGGTGITAFGTGVATALGVNTGASGAFVINGGALGTPSSGTVTNLTGTASININGTVGATTANTGAFTTLSASSTITFSGGAANGVAYLNGSKVLTTGSALVFDGSNLGVGVTAPQNKLQVVTTTRPQFSVSYNGTTGLYLEDATNSSWKSWKLSTSFGNGSDLSFVQSTNTSGTPTWAASAAMTLDASGNLLVGTTTPVYNIAGRGLITINGSSAAALGFTAGAVDKGIILHTGTDMIMSNSVSGAITFQTNNTERARINSTGAFIFAGGTTTANGIGITFPATQSASSDANTLDDYEEGTFTPTQNNFVTTGTVTITGRYVKVGNLVHFNAKFESTGTISFSTSAFIGTPFPVKQATGNITMRLSTNSTSFNSNQSGAQCTTDEVGSSRFFVGSFTATTAGQILMFAGTFEHH